MCFIKYINVYHRSIKTKIVFEFISDKSSDGKTLFTDWREISSTTTFDGIITD